MEINLVEKTEITKSDINRMSSQLLEKLENGDLNPLLLLEHLKAVEKIAETIKPVLTAHCVTEAMKYKEKDILLYGASFKVAESGVTFDFTGCGDTVYDDLASKLAVLKEQIKDRETFLKTIKDSETVVDKTTGEIVTIYPPVRKSSTIVQCTIK